MRRIVGIADHAHPIHPVATTVGEAPCDVAVRADHQRRRAGQGDAVQGDRFPGFGRIGIAQLCAVPDVGHTQVQVRVVGDDCRAAGKRATDRGTVAADAGVRGIGHRDGARPGRQRDLPCRRVAQVEYAGIGHRHRLHGSTLHRCLPARRRRQQEVGQRSRQHGAQARDVQFARVVAVLVEVEEHRVDGEDAVGVRPRLRLHAQQQVFPRPHGKMRQPGIDPRGVGVHQCALARRHQCKFAFRQYAEAVLAVALVDRQRLGADQRREFARRDAALQVHLEEAFLPVHETQCPGEIAAVAGGDDGNAVGIAGDRHCRRQTLHGDVAIRLRPAAGEQPPAEGERNDDDDDQCNDDASNPAHGSPQGNHVIVRFVVAAANYPRRLLWKVRPRKAVLISHNFESSPVVRQSSNAAIRDDRITKARCPSTPRWRTWTRRVHWPVPVLRATAGWRSVHAGCGKWRAFFR